MIPTLALVGRPNVGKSTLFNRLTRSRDALVADIPGLTRDRHYGHGRLGTRPFLVVDTGGLEPGARTGIFREMARQTLQAVAEADAVLFLVDAREGVTAEDREIAASLRKTGRPLWLVCNKSEGGAGEALAGEFHELGLGKPWPVSAAHGDGVHHLIDLVLEPFPIEATQSRRPTRAGRRSRWWADPTSASRRWSTRCSARSASSPSTSPAPPATASTSSSSGRASPTR